ncbi:MAG: PQQ-dependent sugar dehydrogenase, partial [Caulobacterales bacterium]|nr:PQQ-dependent sugar dehydrogenase [Caulobacterales bacterium]
MARSPRRGAWFLAGLAALATACSDGGSSPPPSPPPPPPPPTGNAAPVFTSPVAATAADGAAGPVYVAAATDADGDAVTFSLSGGADQAAFAIDAASGELSFVSPPEVDNPGDADGDNVYVVEITASDGMDDAVLTLEVTVSGAAGPAIVRQVGSGFSQPMFAIDVGDGSGRLFVVERTGRIEVLDPATGLIAGDPLLDLEAETDLGIEGGVQSMALAPDFATSGTFYVFMTNLDGDRELRRYRVQMGDIFIGAPDSREILLTYSANTTAHVGGWIGFGPDGYLYVTTGDGTGDPATTSQNPNSYNGKVLRLDVSGDDFPADP